MSGETEIASSFCPSLQLTQCCPPERSEKLLAFMRKREAFFVAQSLSVRAEATGSFREEKPAAADWKAPLFCRLLPFSRAGAVSCKKISTKANFFLDKKG